MNENITEKLHIIIPPEHAGQRLDQSLASLLTDYSRSQIKDWIDRELVLLEGKPCKGKLKLQGGESVDIQPELKAQPEWEAQAIPLNIVHEDESLIVINKQPGLVVHPGAGNSDKTLLNALLHHAPGLAELPRAGILHRIDKNTSGLLVIAKTPLALRNLNRQLKQKTMAREYQAVVYGKIISGSHIDAPIGRHPVQRKRMAVIDSGKNAVTHYRVAEKFRAHTRLKLKLETGRTHQIRVHMAHIHHPIIGDSTYGGRVQLTKNMTEKAILALRNFKRQALHAYALGFDHPETGEPVRFEIDLPQDILDLLTALREDDQENS